MARSTSSSSATGRSRITSPSKDLTDDNGAILISVIDGEQVHLDFTFGWLTNMSNMTVTAKIVEANNDRNNNSTVKPTEVHTNPTITQLSVIDADVTDNTLKVVIPQDLVANYHEQPAPNIPVYGFFGLEIADAGAGDAQQIWKPVRGLVEVLYSPTEAS